MTSRNEAFEAPLPASAAAEAGGILTIDLAAIAANWRELAQLSAPAECSAVVKADAYGCGTEPVARALRAAGCKTFFVAHLAEARRVREAATDAVIYVLNGLMPGTSSSFFANDLRPVLCNLDEIREWTAQRAASGWGGQAALHVDTGMGRLGLDMAEALALAQRPVHERAGIALLMSHLACAEDPGHPLNAVQMGRFRELRDSYPNIPASLANSSGIFLGPDARHDLVRPGVALYGANPTPTHLNPMCAVVRLEGRVLQVRHVLPGETVGYGATWTARRRSRIAVVAIGYADGLPRSASGSDLKPGADAIVGGHRCPFAGRISMDLLAIDVTDAGDVRRGDMALLLGDAIDVDELAAHAGTIAYEILTNLGARYARRYVGAPSGHA